MSLHVISFKFLCFNLFSETAQISEVGDDGGLVDYEKNSDEIESLDDSEIQPVPKGLRDLEEESVKPESIELLTEPEQETGYVKETKEGMELSPELNIIIIRPCEDDCSIIPQSEMVQELESNQTEEPGLWADPPQPGLVCDAVGTEDSENVEMTLVADDETLEFENAETFVEMEEFVLEVKQEEPTCEEWSASTAEVELDGHKEQFIKQSDSSDEIKNSEEPKQALLLDEEPSESSKSSESSNETETSDQASPTKSTDDVEKSLNETELLDQSERITETETSQLSASMDNTEPKQPDKIQQTEQENHTNSEHQNHESAGQTGEKSPENVHVPAEQLEESAKPVVHYNNGNIGAVDREEACKLAERLYRLDNVQRTDVVQHLNKE